MEVWLVWTCLGFSPVAVRKRSHKSSTGEKRLFSLPAPGSVHRGGKSQRQQREGTGAAASSTGKPRGLMSSELAYIVQDPHPGNSDHPITPSQAKSSHISQHHPFGLER